jgi:hypothetical protein
MAAWQSTVEAFELGGVASPSPSQLGGRRSLHHRTLMAGWSPSSLTADRGPLSLGGCMAEQLPIVTMNIAREWFADILAIPCRKDVEYRVMSDYWVRRLAAVGDGPFLLRLLNGMLPPVPEALIMVDLLERDHENGEFRLHLGAVISVKHWDRKHECPVSTHTPKKTT